MAQITYLEPAFILHARPFRNTSLLLDLFTEQHGRMSAVARGARGPRSKTCGLLQPFVPLLLSWSGRTELVTLRDVESGGAFPQFNNHTLLSSFYLNELLLRLLHRHDPHPELFQAYRHVLQGLESQLQVERILRLFEKKLLTELGYGLILDREASTHCAIEAEGLYRFQIEIGFMRIEIHAHDVHSNAIFPGRSVLSLHHEQLADTESLRDAKRLTRLALAPLLGPQPLKSRELFAKIL